jgi:hypothetical protein
MGDANLMRVLSLPPAGHLDPRLPGPPIPFQGSYFQPWPGPQARMGTVSHLTTLVAALAGGLPRGRAPSPLPFQLPVATST